MVNIIPAIYKLYPQVVRTLDNVAYDVNDNVVDYDLTAVTTQAEKDDCKQTAKDKLAATDWAVLPDVQITNKADFENYRAILRGYVISPVTDPTWPTEPTPVWG